MAFDKDEVYDALNQIAYAPPWGPSTAASHLTELLRPSGLKESESAAIALRKPKTAALVYDRVWGLAGEVPDEIRFGGLSKLEVMLAANSGIRWRSNGRPRSIPKNVRGFYEALDNYFRIAQFWPPSHTHINLEWEEPLTKDFILDISNNFGCEVVPLYASEKAARAEFQPGSYSVIHTIMADLEIVNEDAITWEQVLEFRSDREAQRKYRCLVHWLEAEMVGKDTKFIVEEVEERLEGYAWAIRKHRLKTVQGALSSLLNEKSLLAAGSIIAGGFLSGAPEVGWTVGLAIWLGKVSLEISKELVNLEDALRGPGREIAYIYEARKKLGG